MRVYAYDAFVFLALGIFWRNDRWYNLALKLGMVGMGLWNLYEIGVR